MSDKVRMMYWWAGILALGIINAALNAPFWWVIVSSTVYGIGSGYIKFHPFPYQYKQYRNQLRR